MLISRIQVFSSLTSSLSKKPVPEPKSLSSCLGLLHNAEDPLPPSPRTVPKPAHPKELVHLNPAPVPYKPLLMPRLQKPQRMDELHRESPPPGNDKAVVRPRRNSASSVKYLAKSFEEMEKSANADRAEEEKRGPG
ncbi:hypothetical protein C0993_001769 [Termitomyces sp. T159_Od127]|nr:hypothetical protein C0993_001769 [Termitomyces sp. T159_Od127]